MFLSRRTSRQAAVRLKSALKLDLDLPIKDLRRCANVQSEDGKLISNFKSEEVEFPAHALQALAMNNNVLFVLASDGVYSIAKGVAQKIIDKSLTAAVACNYRSDLLVSSSNVGLWRVVSYEATDLNESGMRSMTVCQDRMFGVSSNNVYYSLAGKYDDWGGNIIYLPTNCEAVVSVNDKVYALGNTCYSLVPKADDIEFKVNCIATNVGAVEVESVVGYDSKAVFATSGGLFLLSGEKITPFFEKLNGLIDFTGCVGKMFCGRYLLSCRSKRSNVESSDVERNDVTLILDLDNEQIVGVLDNGYDSLCVVDKAIYATRNGQLYVITEQNSKGVFVKSGIDFGTTKKKFLDRLFVKSRRDLTVAIHSETETRFYKINGKNSTHVINLRGMGWEFLIELTSEEGIYLEKFQLEAHTCEEVSGWLQ